MFRVSILVAVVVLALGITVTAWWHQYYYHPRPLDLFGTVVMIHGKPPVCSVYHKRRLQQDGLPCDQVSAYLRGRLRLSVGEVVVVSTLDGPETVGEVLKNLRESGYRRAGFAAEPPRGR
jgi:hypothetical protein